MKRPREIYADRQSLFPVRLVGGFICVDFHFGCNGCSFCLNRRDPVLRKILDAGIQFDIASAGIFPDDVYSLLKQSRFFNAARVPVRIGHITDWKYEIDSTHDFLGLLPDDYPIVLMTRFPLDNRQKKTLQSKQGAIAHLTLTPYGTGLNCSPAASQIIDSARDLPANKVFYMLRPLAEGCIDNAKDILKALPDKSHIGLHKLSIDSIPTIGDARPLSEDYFQELRHFARQQGHQILDYFGCLFRRNLGIPFFRFQNAAMLTDSSCVVCPNKAVCHKSVSKIDSAAIKNAASEIGIVVEQLAHENGVIKLFSNTPSARADEIYVSEMFCAEVVISSISRATEPVLKEMPGETISRWHTTGLIDTEQLKTWGNSIEKHLFKNTASLRTCPP